MLVVCFLTSPTTSKLQLQCKIITLFNSLILYGKLNVCFIPILLACCPANPILLSPIISDDNICSPAIYGRIYEQMSC